MKILCDYGCGQEATHHFKNNKWCCNIKIQMCKEIRRRVAEKMRGDNNPLRRYPEYNPSKTKEVKKKLLEYWKSPENIEKIKKRNKKISIANKGQIPLSKGKHFSQKHIENLKLSQTKERRENTSKRMKLLFLDSFFIEKFTKACNQKPTKPEIYLTEILQQIVPEKYKYVGNFEVWIGGKNPDWISINEKKQVIEFFGEYWHKVEHETERKEHFKKYGYDCLVIWESELKNLEELKQKILKF